MAMIRGTTPTHIFELPFETGLLKDFRISYAQDNKILVEKSTKDCSLDGKKITVTLSQEDTLKFSHLKFVEVQLKVLTNDGAVLATPVQMVSIGAILNDEVLV